jgi:hypothetical protein
MKNLILILLFLISSCKFKNSRSEIFKHQAINGVIVKIYNDKWNHFAYTFELKDNESFDLVVNKWPRIWGFAKEGDSVIKRADTLMLILKKKDGRVFEFLYDY